MKTLLLSLSTLFASTAFAGEYYCQDSAVQYITYIASAPYVAHGEKVTAAELVQVSKKASGDGAEAYETYVYKRIDSNEVYTLKLYVEEIGGVCPLQDFIVSAK